MSPEKSALDQLRIDRTAPEPNYRWVWVAGLVFFLFIGAALVWVFRPSVPQVRTLVVREAPEERARTVLNASGYVTARREATVSSKVTGKISEVLFEEGFKVAAGQVLARLDASNTEAGLRLAEAQLQAAKSSLKETDVRLDEAETELRRITNLHENQIASRANLDRAQAEVQSLRARLERQRVETVVAERQLDIWKQQLEDTIIRAPFAGVIISKNAQPGEMISPMSAGGGFTRTGIGTVVDMDSLEIEVDVNESYINRVQPGQPVEAALDSYPDWKIPAKVIAIIPAADRQKATVKVRIGFDQLDPRILPDMGVKVAFRNESDSNPEPSRGIAIPKSAVRQQSGRDVVFIFNNGRAERRAVSIGNTRGDQVTILAGLSSGEKIILQSPDSLSDGDRVEEVKK